MIRDELIGFLIKDRINEIQAGITDIIEEILYCGWKGYGDYTDQELWEVFETLIEDNFDEETAEKIRKAKIAIQKLKNKHERR